MTFSATDAAFEGFRLTRRKPLAVLLWGLVYVLMILAVFGLIGGPIISFFAEMQRLQGAAEPSMEALQALLPIYGAFAAVLPVVFVFSAVLNAAVTRAVVRPKESAFGYLRLGMDEVRVLGVSLVLGIVFGFVSLVGWSIVGFVAGMAAVTEQGLLVLAAVLLGLAMVAGLIWLAVRFSLAIPIVVAERRFAVFDSFAMTKGRFWPLLGMAIIAFVLATIVGLLGGIVFLPVTLMTGGMEQLAQFEGAPLQEVITAAAPALIAYAVVNGVLSALQLAIMYAPFSAAYRDIKAG
ncbi:hypothetical protein [Brevundimonas balnearis]|uniref:Glycerophosphoryl diester phosphodiesterase membrane domain-containing protein n=1 Tax=Brevundimonas balnearis TaxID=1572858 RepID=A0ABV6R4C1_9CAUL